MRVSGATVGKGTGVAVPVGGGGDSGVKVAKGVAVGPMEIGTPMQAVNTSANMSPKMIWRRFMEVLILVKWRGVNGLVGVIKATFKTIVCDFFHYKTIAIEIVRFLC